MFRLVEAEYWRDGGSISAILTDGKATLGLWLQVSRWNQLSEQAYEQLYVSNGPDATRKQCAVPSSEYRSWLTRLRETEVTAASDYSRDRFADLVTALQQLVDSEPTTAV